MLEAQASMPECNANRPALEPSDFVFRRRCKRKIKAMHASATNIAFVAIIARDAEGVMLDSDKILLQREGGEIKEICQSYAIVGREDTSALLSSLPYRTRFVLQPC